MFDVSSLRLIVFTGYKSYISNSQKIISKLGGLVKQNTDFFVFYAKWDVQHWAFGSVFLNSPHCLVKHPPKKILQKKFFKKNSKK
jgi:hypothetical protein